MKTDIRSVLGCGILTIGLAFFAAAPAKAQEPRVPNDPTPAPDLILVSENVAVLGVLPWDLPGVGRECASPEKRQVQDNRSHRRVVAPFGNRSHGRWGHDVHPLTPTASWAGQHVKR